MQTEKSTRVDAAPGSAPPSALGRLVEWLRGPARGGFTLVLILAVVGNAAALWWRLEPRVRAGPDTTARLRATGGGIPLFADPAGRERVHLLKPGGVVYLEDPTRIAGPKYPVHAPIDDEGGIVYEGFVDAGDMAAEDLERVKRAFADERSRR